MAAALTQRRDNAHNARLRFVFSKALAKSRRRADAHLRGRGGLAQPRRDGARRRSDLKTACRAFTPDVTQAHKSTAAILALLSPRASAALDRALRYERIIYDAAVVVHDRRCLEHLGSERCAARGGRAPS